MGEIAMSTGAMPRFLRCAIVLGLAVSAAMNVAANTTGALRHVTPAGCYCGCSQSQARAGCAKMCETPKRASRWGATTCAKPRIKLPKESPGIGPRFARSDRAERASR
jgi:hypothetical protein